MKMLTISLGCLGFFCYFLYDYNSVRKIAGWMRSLFAAGSIFLMAATGILFWENRENLFRASADGIWMAGGVFFLCLLVYTLFFALPFETTYVEESKYREAYTEGIYALCRHPGVLWFGGFYLCAAALWKSTEGILFSVTVVILDVLYVVFQDAYSFPKTFSNYGEYRKSTPFLIPNRRSIARCRNHWRGAGRR